VFERRLIFHRSAIRRADAMKGSKKIQKIEMSGISGFYVMNPTVIFRLSKPPDRADFLPKLSRLKN